jgi:tight adherence protein B
LKKYFKQRVTSVPVFISLCFLGQAFIRSFPLLFITAFFLTVAITYSVRGFHHSGQITYAREQLKSFLELLASRLSSGRTLENAVSDTYIELKGIYESNAAIIIGLRQMQNEVNTGRTFPEVLSCLGKVLICPEAHPLFESMSGLRQSGKNYLAIIRQNLHTVSELLEITKDISGEVSRKRLESLIMSGMPFLVIWSLHVCSREYLDTAFQFAFGSFIMYLCFIISVLSYCITTHLISESIYHRKERSDKHPNFSLISFYKLRIIPYLIRFPHINQIVDILIRLIPDHFLLPRKRILIYLFPENQDILREFFMLHLGMAGTLMLFCFILCLFFPIPFYVPILFFLIILLSLDYDLKKQKDQNRYQLICNLPGFIALLTTLLSSGILLPRAMDLCMSTFGRSNNALHLEFNLIRSWIGAGLSYNEAIERFSDRCQISEISSALLLASQYGKSGNYETLQLLKLQLNSCWIQWKVSARKNLDFSSVKLLIPMMLQMICVITISIMPSMTAFQF